MNTTARSNSGKVDWSDLPALHDTDSITSWPRSLQTAYTGDSVAAGYDLWHNRISEFRMLKLLPLDRYPALRAENNGERMRNDD